MIILSFDHLSKRYGQTTALDDVSFDVPNGEIFGLLGPNGAGKSTLIRILMDIIRADSGEVRVFGESRRRDHLDRLGYLPEERGLYTKQTVIDVMMYFGSLKGLDRADARRRVLDEPTTGLDPVNVRLVQDLLIERRSHGRTTILSTHHMNQVETLCDRVALINKGRLMVYGEVDEVRRRYSLPEVFVRAHGPLPPVPQVASATESEAGTWRLRLADGAPPADVLTALVSRGAVIDRFEPALAPMEDIFLRVVGEAHV